MWCLYWLSLLPEIQLWSAEAYFSAMCLHCSVPVYTLQPMQACRLAPSRDTTDLPC